MYVVCVCVCGVCVCVSGWAVCVCVCVWLPPYLQTLSEVRLSVVPSHWPRRVPEPVTIVTSTRTYAHTQASTLTT